MQKVLKFAVPLQLLSAVSDLLLLMPVVSINSSSSASLLLTSTTTSSDWMHSIDTQTRKNFCLHAKQFVRFKRSNNIKKVPVRRKGYRFIKKNVKLAVISLFVGLILGYTTTEAKRGKTIEYIVVKTNRTSDLKQWEASQTFFYLMFALVALYAITGYAAIRLGRQKSWLAKFQRFI